MALDASTIPGLTAYIGSWLESQAFETIRAE